MNPTNFSHLQSFINSHDDYISLFKKNGFKVITNSKYKLSIVKNNYDNPLTFTDESDYWKMYCRGAVIDIVTNKVIALPPVKAIEITLEDLNSKDLINNVNDEYQSLIDGTMINLFYHKEWIISTRSDIGGYNKWSDRKSFRKLFDESCDIEYDDLNKKYSYSFVMMHTDNRNISPITYNELYLVEVYSFENDTISRLPHHSYSKNNFKQIDSTNINYYTSMFEKDQPYYTKGFTIKVGSKRFKYINPAFTVAKNLKLNHNNPCLTYLHLRQNGTLKLYLSYFPEHTNTFNDYRDKIHKLSNDLYSTYKNVFIHKSTDKKDIPYHLNPLIYEIHKIYLKDKKPTTWTDIKNYIHSLPPNKLMFAINYS